MKKIFCMSFCRPYEVSRFLAHTLILLALVILYGCSDLSSEKASPESEIIEINLEENRLYIPRQDLDSDASPKKEERSILLSLMYPSLSPASLHTKNFQVKQEWHRNIAILAIRGPKPLTIGEFSNRRIESMKATVLVRNEFGLEHYTQTEDGNADADDVWIEKENGSVSSVILCSEKILTTDTPHCKHYITDSTILIKFSYSKTLLPKHRDIKEKVIELFESYRSYEQSEQHFISRIQ